MPQTGSSLVLAWLNSYTDRLASELVHRDPPTPIICYLALFPLSHQKGDRTRETWLSDCRLAVPTKTSGLLMTCSPAFQLLPASPTAALLMGGVAMLQWGRRDQKDAAEPRMLVAMRREEECQPIPFEAGGRGSTSTPSHLAVPAALCGPEKEDQQNVQLN